ncbi:alpha/beta fold hydrolase [Burkholderia oklahomensis]|uniref:alpha/beta fold hydrolase n=1 Tax=Burkholderia oklahomensis TaxID=342113 RepID=UPI00264C8DA5|nr:alpha/beta fold hydrolase [Burkholderia oklahomensis]MDN7671484.1 alpha/beta fold hydrolase [Burkholderia oklahomensis]
MNDSPPIVFIHGFIGCLGTHGRASRRAAPDLLGYGEHRAAPADSITLGAQVEHLCAFIDTHFGTTPVDVVGHSVGGAIAMLLAHAHPSRVRRIVNVEGNFTLDDAFWSASVGRMSEAAAQAMLDGFRADPLAWLGGAVDRPAPAMRETAVRWLDHQPASTLRAMGRSVVETTGDAGYLATLARVFERHPVYLIAGARSRNGWNAPDWAIAQCAGHHVVDGCGHLMMLEQPDAFSALIDRCLAR